MLKQLRHYLKPVRYPVTLKTQAAVKQGHVLFSYVAHVIGDANNAANFRYHSNKWESLEIARIFTELGYDVDAIEFDNFQFIPKRHYDAIFDIFINLARLEPYLDATTIKFLHATGSDPYYQNEAEQRRVAATNQRRGSHCTPKRQIAQPDQSRRAIEIADVCSLIGSEHTLATYPQALREKFTLVPVSASPIGAGKKLPGAFVPEKREFLWYFGAGAIHKGLDLLLEVFAKNPQWTLNIVGMIDGEKDFLSTYHHELTELPNIRYHGNFPSDSRDFQRILSNVFCVVAPTCSEGISPAIVTCLQIGLYPVISRDTGVTLPDGYGTYLEECSLQEIEAAIGSVFALPTPYLTEQITFIQNFALNTYSRQRFRETMYNLIKSSLDARHSEASRNEPAGSP